MAMLLMAASWGTLACQERVHIKMAASEDFDVVGVVESMGGADLPARVRHDGMVVIAERLPPGPTYVGRGDSVSMVDKTFRAEAKECGCFVRHILYLNRSLSQEARRRRADELDARMLQIWKSQNERASCNNPPQESECVLRR